MNPESANWLLAAIALYAAIGVVFAIPFVARWVGRMDPDARRATAGFRMLIFPGAVMLWPLLIRLLLRRSGVAPTPNEPHRNAR